MLDSIIKPKGQRGPRVNLPKSDAVRTLDDIMTAQADAPAPEPPTPQPEPVAAPEPTTPPDTPTKPAAKSEEQIYQDYADMPWEQVIRTAGSNVLSNGYEVVDGLAKFVAYMLTPGPLLWKDEWRKEQQDLHKALAYLSVGALYKGIQSQKHLAHRSVGFTGSALFAPLLEHPRVKEWIKEPEALFDATLQMYVDNYGLGKWGQAGLKRYIAEHPMDLAADIAAMATLGLKGVSVAGKAGSNVLRSNQLSKLRFHKFYHEKLLRSLPRLPINDELLTRVKSVYERLPDVLDKVSEKARYVGTGVEGGNYPPGYWAKIAYYTLMGLDIGNAPVLVGAGAVRGAEMASAAAARAGRIYDIKAVEDVAQQLHLRFHHRRQPPPPKESYTLDEVKEIHRELRNTQYRAFTGIDGYVIQNESLVDFRPVNFAFLRVDEVDDFYAPFVFTDAYQPQWTTRPYHLKEGYTQDEVQEMFHQYYRQGKIKLLEDMSREELAAVGVTRTYDFRLEDFPIKELESNEFLSSVTPQKLPKPDPGNVNLGWEYQRRLWHALEDIEGGLAKHLGNAQHPLEVSTQYVNFKNQITNDIYSGFQEKYQSVPSKMLRTDDGPAVFSALKQVWNDLRRETNFDRFIKSNDEELYKYLQKYLDGNQKTGVRNQSVHGRSVADIQFMRDKVINLFSQLNKRKSVSELAESDPSLFMNMEKMLSALEMDYYRSLETQLGDVDTWSSMDTILLLKAQRKAIGLPPKSPTSSEIDAIESAARQFRGDIDISQVEWMQRRLAERPPQGFTKQYGQQLSPDEVDGIFADFHTLRNEFRADLNAAKQALLDTSERIDQQYTERMLTALQNSGTTDARAVANMLIDTDVDPDIIINGLDQPSLENVRVLVLNHIFENARNHEGVTYRLANVSENPFKFHSEDIELGRILDDLQYLAENPSSEARKVRAVHDDLWSFMDALSDDGYFYKRFSDEEKAGMVELAKTGKYQEILDILHPPDSVRISNDSSYIQSTKWDNERAAPSRKRTQKKKLQVKHRAIYTNPTAEIATMRWSRRWFVSDKPDDIIVIGFDGEDIGIRGIPHRNEYIHKPTEMKNKYPSVNFANMVKNKQVPWLPATQMKAQLRRIGHIKLAKIFGKEGAELLYRVSDLSEQLPTFTQGTYDDIAHYVRKGISNLPTTQMLRDLTQLRKNISTVGPIETLETLFHVIGDKNTRTFLENPASVGVVLEHVPLQLKQQVRSWLSDYQTMLRQLTRNTTQKKRARKPVGPPTPAAPLQYHGGRGALQRLGGQLPVH